MNRNERLRTLEDTRPITHSDQLGTSFSAAPNLLGVGESPEAITRPD
jgi:hypothetical protein